MANIAIITGSAGLIGSQAVEFFLSKGFKVIGIDNDMRRYFFGEDGSVQWRLKSLQTFSDYVHHSIDIRNVSDLEPLYKEFSSDIRIVIHTAAQPSHDWAAKEPLTDFHINATGTLNLLELTRRYAPKSVFIFCSTNKVYGDTPNGLPFVELETRFDLPEDHPLFDGIDERMSIDQSKHSLFGASKASADLMVQEYGRYFGMLTAAFRGGCLTGPNHSGAELHGFLAYLVRCCLEGRTYRIFGYQGKQVRDNIHAYDLINAFWHFYENPKCGEVYNIGGGRQNNCSIQEAIALTQRLSGEKLKTEYVDAPRSGDHIWYISSLKKFQAHYPQWRQEYTLERTVDEIVQGVLKRSEKWGDSHEG